MMEYHELQKWISELQDEVDRWQTRMDDPRFAKSREAIATIVVTTRKRLIYLKENAVEDK